MTKQLLAAIEEQERLSTGSGEVAEERQDALDRYLGEPYGDETEGRSAVVMRDVADTIEWIKPSLLKIFCSGDEVVAFNPQNPEDEEQAAQETEYCNHVVMTRNNGFLVFHDWFHDALLQKNGYILVQHVTETREQREPFRGLSDDEFALLAQGEVEVVEHTAYTDPVTGLSYHDAVVKAKQDYGCVKITNIPPERALIASSWPSVTLDGCPFVEIIDYKTISQLREEGYDVDDDLNDTGDYSDDEWAEDQRNSLSGGDWQSRREAQNDDPASRQVRVRYVWIRYDSNEDGIAELRKVVVVGKTILEDEEDDVIPVACITPSRMPHEHHGQSVADWVSDLQRIRTVLMRGFLDNMYLANNGRHAVDATRVNLDDMLVARPGGLVRVQGTIADAIMPLVHPQAAGDILQAIEMVDSVRENRTGVTKYNQGLDANSLNKTAQGINQIMTAAQQRIDLIARMFAETGVKALMLLVHAISMKHTRQADMVKLRNKWIPVDPRGWKTRRDVTVSVGLGTGNKDQMLGHLMMILQEQKQALPIGLTKPEQVYNTLKRISQNAGFKEPNEFWTDVGQQPPQPPQPTPDQIKAQARMQELQFQGQQDAQKFQAEQQIEQQRMQQQAALDQNRQEMEARQKTLELQQQAENERMRAEYQAQSDAQRLEFERWKAELDAQVKLQIASMQKSQADDAKVQPLIEQLQAMAAELSAPAEILRGPDGRATGVKKGSRTLTIKRGPDGRALGVH